MNHAEMNNERQEIKKLYQQVKEREKALENLKKYDYKWGNNGLMKIYMMHNKGHYIIGTRHELIELLERVLRAMEPIRGADSLDWSGVE